MNAPDVMVKLLHAEWSKDGTVLRGGKDLHAVLLADGQWYVVEDSTLVNGYLSFLQNSGDHPDTTVIVRVPLTEVKAASFYEMPKRHQELR